MRSTLAGSALSRRRRATVGFDHRHGPGPNGVRGTGQRSLDYRSPEVDAKQSPCRECAAPIATGLAPKRTNGHSGLPSGAATFAASRRVAVLCPMLLAFTKANADLVTRKGNEMDSDWKDPPRDFWKFWNRDRNAMKTDGWEVRKVDGKWQVRCRRDSATHYKRAA
jgi:hypothetical protein